MPATTRARTVGTTAWRNAVFSVFALSGLGFATWVSRIPAVRDGMSLSTSTIGLLLFGLAAGSIFGLALAPAALARLGSRRALLYAMLAMAASTVALGLAAGVLASPALTAAVLVVFGFAFSVNDVVMNVEGSDVEKALGRTVLPMMHAFFSLGTIAGALVGSIAAGWSIPVAAHFAALGLVMAAVAAVTVRSIPLPTGTPAARAPQRGHTGPIGARLAARLSDAGVLARDPQLLLLGLLVIGMAFAEGAANDWLPLAAVDGHGFDNATGALVYGTFVAAMTLGRATGGPLIDRLGRTVVLAGMASVGIVGIILFIVTDTPWVAFVAAALWGVGGSLGFPVGISAAADHPTNAARRVSMVSIFGYTAFLVGPPVLGLLGEEWGILNAFYFVAAMLAISLLVTRPATRPR